MTPSLRLDELTGTFSADRSYCDHLFSSPTAENAARIFIYHKWARLFLPHFQVGLLAIAPKRFASNEVKSAEFWTATLTGGIMEDICLIAYLVMRGMLPEAGSVLRRSLEHAGVLTHFLVLAIQPLQFQSRFTKMGSCRLTCGNKIAVRTTSLLTSTPQFRDFTYKSTLA
jgi:hypothetical protein